MHIRDGSSRAGDPASEGSRVRPTRLPSSAAHRRLPAGPVGAALAAPAGTRYSAPMSTRPPTSWALRYGLPGYLFLIGSGLVVGAVLVALYQPDEVFVTIMAAVGGATMLVTTATLLTVARDR